MARVTALSLRAAAREAMLAAGGRGFVRFLPSGGALLATDAVRRCGNEGEFRALFAALEDAGFVCSIQDGLLTMTPNDALLERIAYDEAFEVDWQSALHPLEALGRRWIAKEKCALTKEGKQLILEALRMSWQRPEQADIDALRARGAVMQRTGDCSGMHEAGAVLLGWCEQWRGGNEDEA